MLTSFLLVFSGAHLAEAQDNAYSGFKVGINSEKKLFKKDTMLTFMKRIFIWWYGANFSILLTIARRAGYVGTDSFGNRYFECRDAKESYDSRKRRYVLYKGYAEPSKVPPEWHGWLHYSCEDPPNRHIRTPYFWEKPHLPNLTGTAFAMRPKGSIARGGDRQKSSGDYESWTPPG